MKHFEKFLTDFLEKPLYEKLLLLVILGFVYGLTVGFLGAIF